MADDAQIPTTTPEAAFPVLVFHYTDVLRLLRENGPLDPGQIGDLTGRVKSNLRRDLPRLIEAGVVAVPDATDQWTVTPAGLNWVAGQDVAEGRADVSAGDHAAPHALFMPDPDNTRRDWDSEDAVADLEALANDIAANGLLQNLVVRANPDPLDAREFIIVGGERRWRSIGLLIQRGQWPADRDIPYRRLFADEVGTRLAALAENLQRRNLNPIEEANAYQGLIDVGLNTAQVAEKVSVTQRHVQYRLALLTLSEEQQHRMTLPEGDKDRLSVSDARKLVQQVEARRKLRERLEGELTARQRLVLAEIYQVADGYNYASVRVHGDAMAADPDAVALEKAGLIRIPVNLDDEGRAFTRFDWTASDALTALFSPDRDAAAARLREELGLPARIEPDADAEDEAAQEGYSTAWLNGPFILTPELTAEVAAAQAERAERDRLRTLENQNAQRERQARSDRMSLMRVHAEGLLAAAAHAPAAPVLDDLPQVAGGLEHPLPWRATSLAEVLDAMGDRVMRFGNYYDNADDRDVSLAMLMASSVNAAAGLATPPLQRPDAEPEQEIDGSDLDAADNSNPDAPA